MVKTYLCWQNDNTILGIATSKKKAEELCSELGDSYMPMEANKCKRTYEEVTPLCIYKTQHGFLTYKEALEKGYEFKDVKIGNESKR